MSALPCPNDWCSHALVTILAADLVRSAALADCVGREDGRLEERKASTSKQKARSLRYGLEAIRDCCLQRALAARSSALPAAMMERQKIVRMRYLMFERTG